MAGENNKNLGSANAGLFDASVTLINPNERLVKKEIKSVVVRNEAGKLVRRTFGGDELPVVYDVIKEGEVFVREEETRVIVRTEAGKLVARIKPVEIVEEEIIEDDFNNIEPEIKPEPEPIEEEPAPQPKNAESSGDFRSRLMARHSFLGRMERGEKIATIKDIPARPMEVVNSDLVEEIEDTVDDSVEEVAVDHEVYELENAVTAEKYSRDMGYSSSKGVRASQTVGYVSSGAKNPNEKPQMKGTARAEGLVGNSVLPAPKRVEEPIAEKPKRIKKVRKPVKPWVVVVSLVSIYLAILATYFFTSFNFDKKQVHLVLYYISVGESAKLEYYDGEKFSSNELEMTYYYSDEQIESFNITEDHFAETTLGMGYTIDRGYISGLWVGNYANATSRVVKIKFVIDNLICYVPVTIYRNQLISAEKNFELSNISAGQVIYPTIFGNYSNKVLNDRQEQIKKELSLDSYDLELHTSQGEPIKLKESGCFDGVKYTLPETMLVDGVETEIDYSTAVLYAYINSDGYNGARLLRLN